MFIGREIWGRPWLEFGEQSIVFSFFVPFLYGVGFDLDGAVGILGGKEGAIWEVWGSWLWAGFWFRVHAWQLKLLLNQTILPYLMVPKLFFPKAKCQFDKPEFLLGLSGSSLMGNSRIRCNKATGRGKNDSFIF